uniref:Uncharacterized protein n=1 Tax=Avena sativa TaxID=4498 RepID=A0ACD6A860_AVESA
MKMAKSWALGSSGSDVEDLLQDISHRDKKVQYLLQMGFPEDEAKMAIKRCGLDCAMSVLIDSIHASQFIGDEHEIKDSNCIDSSLEIQKAKLIEDSKKRRKLYGGGAQGNPLVLDCSHEDPMLPPNPMVGFNLPSDPFHSAQRRIPIHATGPPFIYFENMAQAPKGVWDTISQFLDGVKPEYVDSKFFSASTGKRDCLHNLPIDGRYPLPLSRKTIFEALPQYEKWWPSWDPRLQLNCLRTRMASPKLVERISRTLAEDPGNPPAKSVQKYVLGECREWNLVWVGKNRVAPLEPDEMEVLLGFPAHHTRGVCRTKRYRSLRNAFQVDTVAYHLSVLKKMYPNGLNVLSLFSGIGGAEVALHQLGIRMKAVVSVESSAVNRSILKSWWNETQTGRLIEIDSVESLTHEKIGSLVRELGGFQLVIGGSPCNNLTGSNRRHRDGLEGEHSVLFHHYVRIARSVKLAMKTM